MHVFIVSKLHSPAENVTNVSSFLGTCIYMCLFSRYVESDMSTNVVDNGKHDDKQAINITSDDVWQMWVHCTQVKSIKM